MDVFTSKGAIRNHLCTQFDCVSSGFAGSPVNLGFPSGSTYQLQGGSSSWSGPGWCDYADLSNGMTY